LSLIHSDKKNDNTENKENKDLNLNSDIKCFSSKRKDSQSPFCINSDNKEKYVHVDSI